MNQSVKDETHTNHAASTNNVNSVHSASSIPQTSEEVDIGACTGGSSSKEDDWDATQKILNVLLTNPKDFELKLNPSGI